VAFVVIVINAFSGLQGSAINLMVAESVAERRQGTAFETYRFVINIGGIIGPLIGTSSSLCMVTEQSKSFVWFIFACLASIRSGKLVESVGSKRGLIVAFLGVCLSMIAWAYSPA